MLTRFIADAIFSMPWPITGVKVAVAADDFGGNKHVHFVDGAGVEERAQQRAASFDQHVGDATAAEFVEECAIELRCCVSSTICLPR